MIRSFQFNPFTDEGGITEIRGQLDILAVCTQRKDSAGLLLHAADHFFEARTTGDRSQLTLSRLHDILTTDVVPANHQHLYQRQLWPSLLNTLETTMSPFGNCFACERGLDMESLIRSKGSVLIDTSSLTLPQEEYLVASVGWKLYETGRRLFGGGPDSQSRTVLFVDESSSFLTPRLDQEQRHLGPISELMLKARGG